MTAKSKLDLNRALPSPLQTAVKVALHGTRAMRAKTSVSVAVFMALSAAALAPQVSADEYLVANQTELQNAINTANANADPAAVIRLTADVSLVGLLPNPTVPMQIDTQGFTLGGINLSNTAEQTLTLSGTIIGAANTRGLIISSSSVHSSVVNNGSITGGPGTGSSAANISATTFVNNGTLKGGYFSGPANAGFGLQAQRGSHITNGENGLIEGGDSASGNGGIGVSLLTAGGTNSLTNYGIVRGGQSLSTSADGAAGVQLQSSVDGLLTNYGTVEGGSNSVGVLVRLANQTVINSGHIRGGILNASADGTRADAIAMLGASASLTLELQAGSDIEGNVVAGITSNDILRLGGSADSSFDVSAIGATAQYQNFDHFEKSGSSTWVLTGVGTTPTPWQILEGTLQVGAGGTSGSILGDVLNDGTLAFDRSDTLTFDGAITGNGVVVQRGAGTTSLSAAGSNAATLDIHSGALELASGASFAANTTNVAAGASLRNSGVFTGTAIGDTFTLAGTFTGSAAFLDGDDVVQIADGADWSQAAFDGGTGTDALEITNSSPSTVTSTSAANFETLMKRGSGSLTLAGTVAGFSDSITIAEGDVQFVNASVITNQMTIASGVMMTGAGMLSGSLSNAGVLSPGNSPGTIHVGGSFAQAAAGTLISEILPTGTDLLDVSGSAALGGTHQIHVQYGLYLDGTTHTLLQAGGGISGQFDAVDINPSALMSASYQTTANAVTMSFARQSFVSITDPQSNRGRFATWLEEQLDGGNVTSDMTDYIDSLLQQPTAQSAEALLGERVEPPTGMTAAVTQNSISILGAGFARTVFERFALGNAAQCAPMQSASNDTLNCFWAHGVSQWGDASANGRYDWSTNGGQIGVDRELSSAWTLGATFAYADMNTRDHAGAHNDSRSRLGGAYANYSVGRLDAGAMAFYSGNQNDTRRNALIGTTARQARAGFDTDSFGVGARIGYRVMSDEGPLVRPFVDALYDHLDGARLQETGADAANLNARMYSREGLRGTLGLQLANDFEGPAGVFQPALEVGVAHQFGDVRSMLELQPFNDAPAFRSYGPALDRTSYLTRVSLSVSMGENASLTLGYDGEFADNYSQQEGNLSFHVAW